MTDRARRSTESGTGVAPSGPFAAPAGARPGSPASAESVAPSEGDVTDVTPRPALPAVDVLTPTSVEPATPTEVTARAERSEPIRVISMKEATGPRVARTDGRPAVQVQLRSIAEVTRRRDTPVGLGHLAPPRDLSQARKRRLVEYVIAACVAIALAGGIMLAIWWIAGR